MLVILTLWHTPHPLTPTPVPQGGEGRKRAAQVPILPPSSLRITTVAGRGRRGFAASPKGQLLTADGNCTLGAPLRLFQNVVDSPGCWMFTNIVRRSGVMVTPVISQPRGPVRNRFTSAV